MKHSLNDSKVTKYRNKCRCVICNGTPVERKSVAGLGVKNDYIFFGGTKNLLNASGESLGVCIDCIEDIVYTKMEYFMSSFRTIQFKSAILCYPYLLCESIVPKGGARLFSTHYESNCETNTNVFSVKKKKDNTAAIKEINHIRLNQNNINIEQLNNKYQCIISGEIFSVRRLDSSSVESNNNIFYMCDLTKKSNENILGVSQKSIETLILSRTVNLLRILGSPLFYDRYREIQKPTTNFGCDYHNNFNKSHMNSSHVENNNKDVNSSIKSKDNTKEITKNIFSDCIKLLDDYSFTYFADAITILIMTMSSEQNNDKAILNAEAFYSDYVKNSKSGNLVAKEELLLKLFNNYYSSNYYNKETVNPINKILRAYRSSINEAYNKSKVNVDEPTGNNKTDFEYDLTPIRIKGYLDQYVIGQDSTKESLSIAAHNHYRRIQNPSVQTGKSNLLMIGPTGSGKTFLLRTLSKVLNVPFTIADANSLTVAGYVGQDIESILYKLYEAADKDMSKAEKGIIFIDEIDKLANRENNQSTVGSIGVQQALLKVIEGGLYEIPTNGNSKGVGATITMDTSNILFILGGAFVGLDEITKCKKTKNTSIGFVSYNEETKTSKDEYEELNNKHLKEFGLIPELLGRLSIVTQLEKLDYMKLKRILTEAKDNVIAQYVNRFSLDGIELRFSEEAIDRIAHIAEIHEEGARSLQSVIDRSLHSYLFHLPGSDIKQYTVKAADIIDKY